VLLEAVVVGDDPTDVADDDVSLEAVVVVDDGAVDDAVEAEMLDEDADNDAVSDFPERDDDTVAAPHPPRNTATVADSSTVLVPAHGLTASPSGRCEGSHAAGRSPSIERAHPFLRGDRCR
jgi:hypothetical protein